MEGRPPLPPRTKAPALIGTDKPPVETVELRSGLRRFLQQPLADFIDGAPVNASGKPIAIGAVK